MKKISIVLIMCFISYKISAQTSGTLSFNVTTANYTATFSPKHILAIWVADSSYHWVKTCKLMSQNTVHRQYLTNFKSATSSTYNVVDAITGSTLLNHDTPTNNPHEITWDGTDVNGTIVADGKYYIYAEFTSANTTGKLFSASFQKGPVADTVAITNQTFFNTISLNWTPSPNDVKTSTQSDNISIYPNPTTGTIYLQGFNGIAQILNSNGTILREEYIYNGSKSVRFDDFPNGVYFIKLKTGKKNSIQKIILNK